MRNAYVVAYDIAEPKRWRSIYKTMQEYGDRIQYSVFRCELSDLERAQLIDALTPVVHHDEDQVLIVPLGPPGGKNDAAIKAIGKPYSDPDRRAVVVG